MPGSQGQPTAWRMPLRSPHTCCSPCPVKYVHTFVTINIIWRQNCNPAIGHRLCLDASVSSRGSGQSQMRVQRECRAYGVMVPFICSQYLCTEGFIKAPAWTSSSSSSSSSSFCYHNTARIIPMLVAMRLAPLLLKPIRGLSCTAPFRRNPQ